jgi:2-hydroxychromene-2-carboxylate isomerase
MTAALDFWFSIGSTYTYLTVKRLPHMAAQAGVRINWRPFSVRVLMVEQKNIPFRDKPAKAAYMWRDIERRAGARGLKPVVPAPYPVMHWDLVNCLAVLAAAEGWCEDFVTATYEGWFEQSHEPGSEPFLSQSLQRLGKNPAAAIAQASSPDIIAKYEAATDEARALGLFGAPSFVTRGEIFWGDDRLEDALSWARTGHL